MKNGVFHRFLEMFESSLARLNPILQPSIESLLTPGALAQAIEFPQRSILWLISSALKANLPICNKREILISQVGFYFS